MSTMDHTKHHHPVSGRTLADYIIVVRRNLVSILSLTILATIVGLLIASKMTPMYKATTSILIENNTTPEFNQNSRISALQLSSMMQTQIRLIQSKTMAEEVVRRLAIQNHFDLQPQPKGAFSQFLDSMRSEKNAQPVSRAAELDKSAEVPIAVWMLLSKLEVSSQHGGSIINVTFHSADKQLTAKVVNEVAKVYLDMHKENKKKNQAKTVGWLSDKLENVRQKLVASQAQLRAFQESEKIVDSSVQQNVQGSKLSGITSQIVRARAKRADAEAVYDQIQKVLRSSGKREAVDTINDPAVRDLSSQVNIQAQKVFELSNRYGEKHPKLIDARSSLKLLKSRFDQELDRVLTRVKKELDFAKANEREVNRLYAQLKAEFRSSKDNEFKLAQLEIEVSTNRELYDLLLTRLKEADVSSADSGVASVLDMASVPGAPYKPDKKKIILLSLLLGLFLGFSLALYRDSNNRTFKTSDELISKLGLPLLGVFPMLGRKELNRYSPERIVGQVPRSAIAESMNNIRTNILHGTTREPPRVILVTSSVSSEGKTTISSNLSIALSRIGNTLLVEADTRKPRINGFIKGEAKGGILEYVSGKLPLKECVAKDPYIEGLYTMTAKKVPDNPLEFLATKRFASSLKFLRKKFDYIVVDSPPLLPVSDGVILSPLCDGVIMVVGAEETRQNAVSSALMRLQKIDAEILGVVLSRANIKTMGYYSDHHYYGYDYYSSDKRKTSPA